MKSICIKTNNKNTITFLLNSLKSINMDSIVFSIKQFKNYQNIIIHYIGTEISLFYTNVSNILTNCILAMYEGNIVSHIINLNYFYFDDFEKRNIYNDCINCLGNENTMEYIHRRDLVFNSLITYIKNNHSLLLSGFVNFRLSEYNKYLDNVVDIAVNKYILEKEYREFISLLKLYVESKDSNMDKVHLIYMNTDTILLDGNKNIVDLSKNVFNAKYLSDISFSSNDYVLNTILELIPKEIDIHLITPKDEFIESLHSIFGHRVHFCTDCDICTTYRLISKELTFLKNEKRV